MANFTHHSNGQFALGGTDIRPKHKRPTKRHEMMRHAYDFERITHKMLLRISKELGLDDDCLPQAKPANGHPVGQINGDATPTVATTADDGSGNGEPVSNSLEISRDTAQIIVGLARSWDLSAERIRILKGVPMPGSRRPSEVVPKPRKPKNKPPDTLADMPSPS